MCLVSVAPRYRCLLALFDYIKSNELANCKHVFCYTGDKENGTLWTVKCGNVSANVATSMLEVLVPLHQCTLSCITKSQ